MLQDMWLVQEPAGGCITAACAQAPIRAWPGGAHLQAWQQSSRVGRSRLLSSTTPLALKLRSTGGHSPGASACGCGERCRELSRV